MSLCNKNEIAIGKALGTAGSKSFSLFDAPRVSALASVNFKVLALQIPLRQHTAGKQEQEGDQDRHRQGRCAVLRQHNGQQAGGQKTDRGAGERQEQAPAAKLLLAVVPGRLAGRRSPGVVAAADDQLFGGIGNFFHGSDPDPQAHEQLDGHNDKLNPERQRHYRTTPSLKMEISR